MLVELLFNFVYLIFYTLTVVIKVPAMPIKVTELLGVLVEYVSTGIAILGNYCDMPYLLILFTAVATVDTAVLLYKIIMWVLRKIPILGIS